MLLKTINSMSKTHFYRTFKSTHVVVKAINPANYELLDVDIVFNGDITTGFPFDSKYTAEEYSKELDKYVESLCEKNIEKGYKVVKVIGRDITEKAIALSYNDLEKYGTELVQDEQGRWCMPDKE